MLILYTILLVLLIIIIFLFSSSKLSPIPYFPSQPVDMPLIVKALNLRNDQTVIDLGAGDGIVIFKAADEALRKKLNTKFVAVEINPILILVLHIRRLLHPNRKNIKIILNDIFKMDFSLLTPNPYPLTIYLYISPWLIEKVTSNIRKQSAINNQQLSIVSYMYQVRSLKKSEKIIQGKNKIYIYWLRPLGPIV